MTLRFRDTSIGSLEERRKLKPQKGDTVRNIGDMRLYVIDEVGTKAARVHLKDGDPKILVMVYLKDIVKVDEFESSQG